MGANWPDRRLTISEPENPDIVEFYLVQKRRVTDDFKDLKLRKGRSGTVCLSV